MVDPIQKTSSVPVPNAQGIVTGRDPSIVGTPADQGRVKTTVSEKKDDFANYLNKTSILSEEKTKKSAGFDPASEFLAGSPYASGSKYPA
jgi:hypothetical protein